jgi:hypothetical protein
MASKLMSKVPSERSAIHRLFSSTAKVSGPITTGSRPPLR